MVQITALAKASAAALLFKGVAAHPGEAHDHEKIRREIQQRDAYSAHIARSLANCARSPDALALNERAIQRRAAKLESLRARTGLKQKKRDEAALESWEKTSHNETGEYSSSADASTLFASNASCVVTPEAVVGPYWVSGELVRSDVVESESGVPVHLEMQFVDISTCKAVSSSDSMLVDLWHANATGVYSGVSGEGGLNTDFLRGVQQTDDDGVVEFDTIFPGHYQGRCTHMHIMTHSGSTLLSNNTYSGGTVRHIGQLFFDETLRSAVEATSPYSTNTQSITSNDDDGIAPSAASAEYDPFPKYLYLGDSVSDGLLMWISVGVDMSADYTDDATAAAVWGEDGGYSTGNSANGGGAPGGGSGGPGGNGTMSGSPPSGSGAPPSGSGSVMPSGSGAPSGATAGGSANPTGSLSNGASAGSASSSGAISAATSGSSSSIPLFTSGGSTSSHASTGNTSLRPSTSSSATASAVAVSRSTSSARALSSSSAAVAPSASSSRRTSSSSSAVAVRPTTASTSARANPTNSVSSGHGTSPSSSSRLGSTSARGVSTSAGAGAGHASSATSARPSACRGGARPSGSPPSGFSTLPRGSASVSGQRGPSGSGALQQGQASQNGQGQQQNQQGQNGQNNGQFDDCGMPSMTSHSQQQQQSRSSSSTRRATTTSRR